jgi:Ca2+/Na+ antiporter
MEGDPVDTEANPAIKEAEGTGLLSPDGERATDDVPEASTTEIGKSSGDKDDDDGDDGDDDDDESGPIMSALEAPWRFAFKYTVPDCGEEEWENWYMLTFVMCIVWIGLTSFFMATWCTAMGCMLNFNSGFMGLTVVAVGTSVPDALASISVAREGHGNMAVSNAIGSNVFDIFLGLGLPWAISTWMVFRKPIEVTPETMGVLFQAFVQLVGTLFVLLAALAYNKFVLTPKLGYGLMSLYGLFVIISFATNRG